ncbi:hypothetical protein [Oceanidesulfovibrio marinus]|uniref:Uncharacterized protein n=1 Tax=Oceanidesulfovibrio marinus TaxID=370038 RepID=A0A6P1ZA18_9BACT|nr:hypothetical protein [Oceanidesulfovibrio marinus]QJT10470.1 hypothetical protein E8L03_16725 [Oceanidesulfovibrio marinus]TVM30327.1 hypothetical protein DQK91_21240 [Oceanidesulfovibrio marinus]
MDSQAIYHFLDPIFIWVFRIPGDATLGFALGLAWIALITSAVGELAIAGVYYINRSYFRQNRTDMVSNHNLSIRALMAKDKGTYKACNDLANDAFGKTFFSNIALFAASLWPAFFALGWLGYRFGDVNFTLPLAGAVGPNFFFVPTYIVVRVLFSNSKKYLPVFRKAHAILRDENPDAEQLINYLDYMDVPQRDSKKERGETATAS